jgi:nucleotide-binding universal stress UspA family protein
MSTLMDAPVIVGVDGSAAGRTAVDEGVALAAELEAPLVFVHVRRGPAGFLGAPVHQRRLTRAMEHARRALDCALGAAQAAGVDAQAEILEGSPKRRIVELARDRGAQLVVVGSRRRRLGRSVGYAVARSGGAPTVVAARRPTQAGLRRAAA